MKRTAQQTDQRPACSSPLWWVASFLLLSLISWGCWGGCRFFIGAPFFSVGLSNKQRDFYREEVSLRRQIVELRALIIQKKRHCYVVDCLSSEELADPNDKSVVQGVKGSDFEIPDSLAVPGAVNNGVVLLFDTSETMGLHVNTGPNVENRLKSKRESEMKEFLQRTTRRRIGRVRDVVSEVLTKIEWSGVDGFVETESCGTVKVVSAPPPNILKKTVNELAFQEKKPLALALRKSIEMVSRQGKGGSIIAFTDGRDECQQDPCQVFRQAKKERQHQIQLFLFNMGETENFTCLQRQGAVIYQPKSKKELQKELEKIFAARGSH